jgi:BatD DUF11 like domain
VKRLIVRGWIFLLLAAFGTLAADAAQAAQARAWLDREHMQMGETITLNVELTDGGNVDAPDFSALSQDFNLLGTSNSSAININNGVRSAKLLWAVGLEPKHAGALTIPALKVGTTTTAPLTLIVTAAAPGSVGKQGDDVYIEVLAEPRNPFVQQQVRYTLRLYYALNLTEGNLEDLRADSLVVQKLGQDANFQATIGTRRYHVVERRYALIPEKSGAVSIPALTFRGRAIDPSDPNSFFNRGRQVGARGESIELQVRPRPPESGNGPWLPAASLDLTADGFDATSELHVGDPLTVTVRLKAQGLGFEQLPEVNLGTIDGAEVYPDKPVTRTRDDAGWLYGERERKFALVPTRAGDLQIPTLEIHWWNTEKNQAEVATLAAQTLKVLPAVGANAAVVAPANSPVDPGTQPAVGPLSATTTTITQPGVWRPLAIAAFALWLLTLFAWWWYGRGNGVASPIANAPSKTAKPGVLFRTACARKDLPAIARALLIWARSERAGLRNLGELAGAIDDPAQRQAIAELERARFGALVDDGLAARLESAFRSGLHFTPTQRDSAASVLPPLYPFQT